MFFEYRGKRPNVHPAVMEDCTIGDAAHWIELSAAKYVALSRSYLAQGLGVPQERKPA